MCVSESRRLEKSALVQFFPSVNIHSAFSVIGIFPLTHMLQFCSFAVQRGGIGSGEFGEEQPGVGVC